MRPGLRFATFLVVSCLLVGCSSPAMVNRAVVRNATSAPITEVRVVHQPTQRSGGAGKILPREELDLGFSRQPMKGKRAVVTWKHPGAGRQRVELALPRSGGGNARTYTLVYTIAADGSVSVHLES